MDILIVSQYLRNIENFEGNNSRFVYLAKMIKDNHSVEILTSNFFHGEKRHFKNVGNSGEIKVTALYEPGYKKNVSFKRIYSHKVLAKNIARYLENRKKPDVIYVAIPSLDVAEAVANYCKKSNVKFVIDIQDLWPEAFKMVLKIPYVTDVLFKPMEIQANKIYSLADEVVAVSETYANHAMKVNKKCKDAKVVYLGTEKETFDSYAKEETPALEKKTDEIWVGYIGSLSASYDIKTVIDALKEIKTDKDICFVVMGSGPKKEEFEEYAKEQNINCIFTGSLPYSQMCATLKKCDIAVNPIKKGSAGSIINKVGDFAMAGLPVVNTQECEEYRDLLLEYNAGINCECENSNEVAQALLKLIENPELLKEMSANSRRLGEEKFDRENTYKIIYEVIANESLISQP